jgi:phosphatidylserine decarboxylase
MITRYGIDVVVKIVVVLLVLNAGIWFLTKEQAVRIPVFVLSGALLLFTMYFFRDPERKVPREGNAIISPADGKVVRIKEVMEEEFLKQRSLQVSIFMSPLNVHVNRFPISGTVQYYKYITGRYLVAFGEKSSDANERTHIGIENGTAKILFKQIAGFVARRIVAEVTPGMSAVAGARFGMIKFGSRVDVFMPSTCRLKVNLNETVVGGETVLAVLTEE